MVRFLTAIPLLLAVVISRAELRVDTPVDLELAPDALVSRGVLTLDGGTAT